MKLKILLIISLFDYMLNVFYVIKMKELLQQIFFHLLSEYSQKEFVVNDFTAVLLRYFSSKTELIHPVLLCS